METEYKMPRIIIEVSGGMVQGIASSVPVEVYIRDFDNIEQGAPDILEWLKTEKDDHLRGELQYSLPI